MLFGKKEKEVKTHIPEPDFDEFLHNLAEDNLSRSEFMRIKIEEYNTEKRKSKKSQTNIVRLFRK